MRRPPNLSATKLLILSGSMAAATLPAGAAEVTILSWGGSYETSQVEAYNKPFAEKTGMTVNMTSADNPATPIKAQVEAGNVTVDVADVEFSDAVRLCDEGLILPLNFTELPPAPDGTPAVEDFIEGALDSECAVASIVWSTVVAYDESKVQGADKVSAFFDLEKFPGKRGLRKGAKANLELALIADGVPGAEIYEVLATPEGVKRAFAKLDTIKSSTVWWEAGAQPPQLLADGEVVMTTAYNGRIFNAAVQDSKPFKIIWDGQIMDFDLFVIPKGAPNPEAAWEYIKFATDTQRLADQAKWISYGPTRRSSAPLVGKFMDGKTEMGPEMPTNPDNMGNFILNDFEFWADRDAELNEQFNAWLTK